ncbi:hypothetical protein [Pedobacter sp. Leaf176]|uniref:hypothetical protein n=1 Tax=Pedobacter sp. Leaf176 TaxID=1736286 RepID=UPI000AC2F20A|nr:hypothetical protein [Pedobacter sp. Leaf176]
MKNILFLLLTVLISTAIILIGSDYYEPELIYSTVLLIWLFYLCYQSYSVKRKYSE